MRTFWTALAMGVSVFGIASRSNSSVFAAETAALGFLVVIGVDYWRLVADRRRRRAEARLSAKLHLVLNEGLMRSSKTSAP